MFRDWFCRRFHSLGWPYCRDGETYQRCTDCGRELESKVKIEGRAPFCPYTEREMTGLEKHWNKTAQAEVDELERMQRL